MSSPTKKLPPFIEVKRSKLPRRPKEVLATIVSFSQFGDGRMLFMAVDTIAEQCGVNTQVIQRAVSWLLQHGLLTLVTDRLGGRRGEHDPIAAMNPNYQGKGRTAIYEFNEANRLRLAAWSEPEKEPARGKSVAPKTLSLPTRADGSLDEDRMTPTLWNRYKRINSNPVPGYQVRPDFFLASTPYPGTQEPRTRVPENPVPGYSQDSDGLRKGLEIAEEQRSPADIRPVDAVENQPAGSPTDQAEQPRASMPPIEQLAQFGRAQMMLVNELRPVDQKALQRRLRAFAEEVDLDVDLVPEVARTVFVTMCAAQSIADASLGGILSTSEASRDQGRIRGVKLTSPEPIVRARRSLLHDRRAGDFQRLAAFAGELLDGRRELADDVVTLREHLRTWCARQGLDDYNDLVASVETSELTKLKIGIGRYKR